MRCISLWQPWALLYLTPAKEFETRHWSTRYRGPLLIHAAKRKVGDIDRALEQICAMRLGRDWRGALAYGALIGRVELIDCVSTNDFEPPFGAEHVCGDWSANRFGWRRARELVKFATPIPYIGRQGFFSVPDDVFRDAKAAA
jgi:activating signal cointegrator 1